MKVNVDGLTVYFPYPYIYPEQFLYMRELKRALDAQGHAMLEMPTGTGKTVTLLSLIMSYQLIRPEIAKLIYCTRTVGEIGKVLEELETVVTYRNQCLEEDKDVVGEKWYAAQKMLAVGLTTRRNLCLEPRVHAKETREEADAECRKMTASWVRQHAQNAMEDQAMETTSTALCSFYEQFDQQGKGVLLPPGIYTLDRIMSFSREKHWCPYYTARHALNYANVIVYNYQYLLDPKIAGLISSQLARESIVVFDEAHNIDNVCIDALSVTIRQRTLSRALGNLQKLSSRVAEIKDLDAQRLQEEYQRLFRGVST